MSSTSKSKTKRPKISELPKHKPPPMRQLKVTAFFQRGPQQPTQKLSSGSSLAIENHGSGEESSSSINMNSSIITPEITICESNDEQESDIEEIFCSEELLEKRKSLARQEAADRVKRKYCDADFVEFETYNYNDETIVDKRSAKERRRCPFYKRIPYTNICVDAFNFAKEDNLQHYFLSHFHADHYIGMTKGFDKPIYCTPITARLVRHKFKVAPKYLKAHELNEPFYIGTTRCTFFDANHCPGAAIILFELQNTMRYLHTGDFRACPEMEQIYDLKNGPIDCCFLDTTFCDASKTFPPQKEVLENTVNVCKYALEKNPRTLIVCGSYCIGKEKVFLAVAEALNLKVWCNQYKRGYFNCIKDPRLEAALVEKQEDAKIHVLPLKSLWKRGMREYLEKHFDHFDAIVALRPSGWEYKRNKHMVPEVEGNIAIYPVPYSEHSSYTDLQRFILWLRPRRIIPTVNMGDPIKRGQMNHIFRRWQRTPYVAPPPEIEALVKSEQFIDEDIGNDPIVAPPATGSKDVGDITKEPEQIGASQVKVDPDVKPKLEREGATFDLKQETIKMDPDIKTVHIKTEYKPESNSIKLEVSKEELTIVNQLLAKDDISWIT